jgi:hypothetical protein
VSDDDDILRVTIPAGTLRRVGSRRFFLNDPTGALGGIRSLRLEERGPHRVSFRLKTVPLALAAADRVDHFVEVSLHAGSITVTATPLWHVSRNTLVTMN